MRNVSILIFTLLFTLSFSNSAMAIIGDTASASTVAEMETSVPKTKKGLKTLLKEKKSEIKALVKDVKAKFKKKRRSPGKTVMLIAGLAALLGIGIAFLFNGIIATIGALLFALGLVTLVFTFFFAFGA